QDSFVEHVPGADLLLDHLLARILEIHRHFRGNGGSRAAKGTNFDYVTQAYGEPAVKPGLRSNTPATMRMGRVQYGQSARYSAGAFAMLPERESRCCA
ncbi:MAG TPA: hypothetical protein VFO35_10665, partial [Steroidobacteraceae bacterium]|nr:hypothetical protein [Steroidobacteraceae bacterium]